MTENNLVITRMFDAPRELVYRAFVDPDQLSQWFGPVGFSVPRETMQSDVRVGGHQRFTMVNDETGQEENVLDETFEEVIENELLVGLQRAFMDGSDEEVELHLRLEFHDEPGGRTRLVLTQGPFPEDVDQMAAEGWESSFTKLDKLLTG